MAQYISIVWDSMVPDFEMVKGHVSVEVFRKILHSEGVDLIPLKVSGHYYARWIPVQNREYDMMIKLCKKGPGAFPVTIAYYK